MNCARFFLSALALIFSLASCAPSITGPGGQPLRTISGAAFASTKTLLLAEVTAQTPADSYVTFPDCTGAAVMVADVRSFGLDVTSKACREAATSSGLNAGDVLLIAVGGAVLGFAAFLALVRLYVGSIS